MKLKTDKIESRQFLFTVICFLQCVTIHVSMMMNLATQSSLFVLIASMIMGILLVFIIAGLEKVYGQIGLHKMAEIGLGSFFGKIVSILYVLFFFWKFCDTVFEFSSFVNDTILPKTPAWVILILIISVCVFATNLGIAVISSMCFLLTLTVFIITLGSALFLIPKYELGNFLPLFAERVENYFRGFAISSAEPFGELIVFLTVIPHVKNIGSTKKIIKTLLIGLLLGTVTFVINIIRDTGTLGVLIKYFIFPTFESIRMINIGEIFSRVEIFYAGVLMMLAFIKASVWLFATCEMLKGFNLNKISKYNPLIFGGLAFVLTVIGNKFILNSIYTDMTFNLIVNAIFEYIVPLILLILGTIIYALRRKRDFNRVAT